MLNMKQIFYFFFSFLLFFNTFIFAQSITWQRTYDLGSLDDEANAICQSIDGNFYVVGYAHGSNTSNVMKINNYGDTLWKKYINIYGFYAVVPTSDGGCVLTGHSDSSFTIKLSSSGSLIWKKKYSGPYDNASFNSLYQTSDGFFIAAGYNFSSFYIKGYAMKVDSIGNLIWERQYETNGDMKFGTIIETNDGKYLLSGRIYEQNIGQAYLLKIDTSGTIVWEKKFQINNSYTTCGKVNRISNGYVAGGLINDNNIAKPYFVKTNLNGDTIHSIIFQFPESNYFQDLKIINSNRYVLSCLADISNDSSARVLITDSTGNIINQRFFTYGKYASFHAIQTLNNRDIIFAGSAEPLNGYWYDTYIVRTDSNLNAPPIGINHTQTDIPNNFVLEQNYPNPFNGKTIISYSLPIGSYIDLAVYDILGREIAVLKNGYFVSGTYNTVWDASNVSSGIYILRLFTKQLTLTRKIILIK